MSDEIVKRTAVEKTADYRTSVIEQVRDNFVRYTSRAAQILEEIAEGGENDRVRLAAAESILDRAGLGKTQTTKVEVSQAEHDIATNEAEALVARIADQKQKQAELAAGAPKPSITALMILEGDDDTLPTSLVSPSTAAVDVESRE